MPKVYIRTFGCPRGFCADGKSIKRHSQYYVYMVHCADGTYYTGSTNNLERRLKLHNTGNGAKYLRGRVPVEIVYAKAYRSKGQALRAEARIKTLSRDRKMQMAKIYHLKPSFPLQILPAAKSKRRGKRDRDTFRGHGFGFSGAGGGIIKLAGNP